MIHALVVFQDPDDDDDDEEEEEEEEQIDLGFMLNSFTEQMHRLGFCGQVQGGFQVFIVFNRLSS